MIAAAVVLSLVVAGLSVPIAQDAHAVGREHDDKKLIPSPPASKSSPASSKRADSDSSAPTDARESINSTRTALQQSLAFGLYPDAGRVGQWFDVRSTQGCPTDAPWVRITVTGPNGRSYDSDVDAAPDGSWIARVLPRELQSDGLFLLTAGVYHLSAVCADGSTYASQSIDLAPSAIVLATPDTAEAGDTIRISPPITCPSAFPADRVFVVLFDRVSGNILAQSYVSTDQSGDWRPVQLELPRDASGTVYAGAICVDASGRESFSYGGAPIDVSKPPQGDLVIRALPDKSIVDEEVDNDFRVRVHVHVEFSDGTDATGADVVVDRSKAGKTDVRGNVKATVRVSPFWLNSHTDGTVDISARLDGSVGYLVADIVDMDPQSTVCSYDGYPTGGSSLGFYLSLMLPAAPGRLGKVLSTARDLLDTATTTYEVFDGLRRKDVHTTVRTYIASKGIYDDVYVVTVTVSAKRSTVSSTYWMVSHDEGLIDLAPKDPLTRLAGNCTEGGIA